MLTLLATLLLFKLGPIIFDRENESEEEVSSSQGSPDFWKADVSSLRCYDDYTLTVMVSYMMLMRLSS